MKCIEGPNLQLEVDRMKKAKRGRDKQQSSSLPGVQLSRVSQVKTRWQLPKTDSKQLLLSFLNQVVLSFPSFDFPKNKYNMRWSYLLEKNSSLLETSHSFENTNAS